MKLEKINIYILIFCFVNAIQALFTPILNDEAYYWIYSQYLDLGYFDHPPMVAFLIKLGTGIFSNSLFGVRFFTIILSGFTLKVIWNLIPSQNKENPYSELLFLGIILSMPLFNVFGFITTPDVPLLFSSALFLLAVKRFDSNQSLLNTFIFGLALALMVYAKYHGGIVILLAMFLRLELLKKPATYLAGIFGLILILPHLYWQFENDFITFDYHFFQRNRSTFKFEYIYHYALSAFGVLNPALFILLTIHLIKSKSARIENRFLLRMFWGFLLFFFIYSLRARVEAHWVLFAIVPMSVLLFNIASSSEKLRNQLKYAIPISVGLIVIMRVLICIDLPLNTEFHKEGKDYYMAISDSAGDRKVVFENSYRQAAKYSFYTGETTYSDNNVFSRKNHYDLLAIEESYHGEQVIYIQRWESPYMDTLVAGSNEIVLYQEIDHFEAINKVRAEVEDSTFYHMNRAGQTEISIYNPYPYPIELRSDSIPHNLQFCILDGSEKEFVPLIVDLPNFLNPEETLQTKASWEFREDILPGEYQMQITMQCGKLYPKVWSKKYDIEIE